MIFCQNCQSGGGTPSEWPARADAMNRAVAPHDVETVLVAAWLHDIGYSPTAVDTGFHPLDGARYLSAHGWPARICSLVAHHSAAVLMASERGSRCGDA
jgi:HD superfamily phosphodiesterase